MRKHYIDGQLNGIIYKITSPSGKVYIGQTVKTLHKRKLRHTNTANNPNDKRYDTKIARAVRKYGNLLIWEILIEGIKTYEELLEPFITVFTFALPENEKQIGINKLKSLEYRKAGFNLMTFGSDDVVKSYNKIMQAFYTIEAKDLDSEEYAIIMLSLISDLLLNIRKDLYTKTTKLNRSEMLEPMINDIKKYEVIINNRKL